MAMPATPNLQSTASTLVEHVLNSKSMHSPRVDRLVSLVEGTPGLDVRQIFDVITSTYVSPNNIVGPILPGMMYGTDLDVAAYNARASFREQLAYLASLDFDPAVALAPGGLPADWLIAQSIWHVINFMEQNVLPKIAPDESRILRSSVLANLEVTLSDQDRQDAALITSAIRKACETDMADFAATMHLDHLTHAQRLAKIKEALHVLRHHNISLPADANTAVDRLKVSEKLKWLEDLDVAYRQVGEAYNSVRNAYRHFGARSGVLSPTQITTISAVVAALGDKKLSDYVTAVTDGTGWAKMRNIDDMVRELHTNPGLAAACKTNGITVRRFDEFFSRYVAFERLRSAKGGLEATKDRLLGQNRKSYDLSVEAWKNHARGRITQIVGARRAGFTLAEANEFASYLEKWSSIYAPSENAIINDQLQAALGAALDLSPIISTNPALRARAIEYIQGQGGIVEGLVHSKENIFEAGDTLAGSFLHAVSRTENARKAVVKHTAPFLKGMSRFLETATKQVLGTATTGTVALGRWIGKVGDAIAKTTRPEIKGKWLVTRMAQRVVKFPFFMLTGVPSKILTTTFGKVPAEIVDWTSGRVKAVHNGAISAINAGTGASDADMTGIFSTLLDRGFGAVGKVTSWGGQRAYDMLTTAQQSQVFDRVLEGVDEEDEVRAAFDGTALAAAFNGDLGLGLSDHLGTTLYVGSMKKAANALSADDVLRKKAYDAIATGLEHWVTDLGNREIPPESRHTKTANDATIGLIKELSKKMKTPMNRANRNNVIRDAIQAAIDAIGIAGGPSGLIRESEDRVARIHNKLHAVPTGLHARLGVAVGLAAPRPADQQAKEKLIANYEAAIEKTEAEWAEADAAREFLARLDAGPSSLRSVLADMLARHHVLSIAPAGAVAGPATDLSDTIGLLSIF